MVAKLDQHDARVKGRKIIFISHQERQKYTTVGSISVAQIPDHILKNTMKEFEKYI
jgi:hypothetical protein